MTLGYMVRKELQREKLRCRAARRAWGYEKRLEEEKGNGLGRECRGEIKKRFEKGKVISEWKEKEVLEGKKYRNKEGKKEEKGRGDVIQRADMEEKGGVKERKRGKNKESEI